MLWIQKRNYFGIFIEQLLVAVVLMLCIVSVAEAVKKYRIPGMMNVDNVLLIGYMFQQGSNKSDIMMDDVRKNMAAISDKLRKLPFVESVSFSLNLTPYTRPASSYLWVSKDSVVIDENRFEAVLKYSDEFGASIFKLDMEEGTWLENHSMTDGAAPAVITRQLADKAGWTAAVGKKITIKSGSYTVVGVAAGLKQHPFEPSPVAMVIPEYTVKDKISDFSEVVVRLKSHSQDLLYDVFNAEFKRLMPKGVEPLVYNMESIKSDLMNSTILSIVLQAIPTVFLLIFAFIGTFSLYRLHFHKQRKEFALRIALGSTKSRLMAIVIGESLLITCIAVIPALLLSFFIYEYAAVHVIGVGVTVGVMLLFSAVSAWYPAWKVSRVNPAEALQYE
jgi:ABC-type antimicrobial peptide transport system permease subunit